MNRKFHSLILLSLAMVLFLIATPLFAGSDAPQQGKKKVITFWHLDTDPKLSVIWQGMADEYMAAHPNVDVQITILENDAFKTKINTMMQSGNPPDIFRSWGGGVMNEYAEAGLLKEVSPAIKNEWVKSIGEGLLGLYSYKGKCYGVPYDMGAVGIWYNKDMFKAVGYETPPATFEQLIDCLKKLKAAGYTPVSLGEGEKWPGHFWWVYMAVRLGGKDAFDAAYSRKGAFTDPPFVKAGELLLQLVDLDIFQPGFLGANYPEQAAIMGNGQAAMELMGQWAPAVEAQYATNKTGIGADKLGFFPFPMIAGGKGKITDVMGGGNGYILGKNASEEAMDFLNFIVNVENQKKLAEKGFSVPTIKGAEVAIQDPMMRLVQKMVSKATYYQLYYDQYLAPAVGEAVKDATQLLFAKTATPEEAAAMIEKAMKENSK